MSLAHVCHRCPHVQKPPYTNGACACLFNPAKPVDILDRIESGDCPAGYFSGAPMPVKATHGPGDMVKLILTRMGFVQTPDGLRCPNSTTIGACGCEAMRQRMNELGYLGCIRERRELAKWFADKAAACGIDVPAATLRSLFWVALKEWHRSTVKG